jgi:hypothetical protein
VVTMRSMASGAMGPSADRAQGALREMAAALLAPDRQMQAQSELATRAGGREVPAITPFLPEGTVAPQPRPSGPVPPAAAPAVTSAPAPPAPYIAPPRREEEAIRHSVYEAPDRPLQTYPSLPAVTFAPAAAAPQAPVEPAPAAEPAPEPAIPTWGSEAPSSPPAASVETSLPAPAEPEAAPAPPEPEPEPEPSKPSGPLPWEYVPPAAATATNPPAPAFSTAPPAPAAEPPAAAPSWSPSPPPAPASPEQPAASPSWSPASAPATPPEPPSQASPVEKPPGAPTWTPMEQPVWTPGKAVPAEPLGTGEAIPALELSAQAAAAPVETKPADAPSWTPSEAPAPSYTTPPSAPARRPPAERERERERPRSGDKGPSERPAWLVPAAIAAAVVILLGVFGVFVLANRGGGGTAVNPSPSTRPTTSPRTSPSTTPTGGGLQTVPTYGPNSAAPITKVQFCTKDNPCAVPGQAAESATVCSLTACSVEVAIYFSTSQKSVPVAYTIKFFDRCTGRTTDLPGARTTTPASGYIVVIPTQHLTVRIPAGVKSGALVAVTQQPSAAASQPLLLGADSC